MRYSFHQIALAGVAHLQVAGFGDSRFAAHRALPVSPARTTLVAPAGDDWHGCCSDMPKSIASASVRGSYGSSPLFQSHLPPFGAWVRPGSCHRNDKPRSARYAGALSAPHWSRRIGSDTPPVTCGGMSSTMPIGMSRSIRPKFSLIRTRRWK